MEIQFIQEIINKIFMMMETMFHLADAMRDSRRELCLTPLLEAEQQPLSANNWAENILVLILIKNIAK